MKRRELILSFAAAWLCTCGRLAVAATTRSINKSQIDDEDLAKRIERIFTDAETAKQIGLEYMAKHPELASTALDRIREQAMPISHGGPVIISRWLEKQKRKDFKSSDSIIIKGWVLARCEADLCAVLVYPYQG